MDIREVATETLERELAAANEMRDRLKDQARVITAELDRRAAVQAAAVKVSAMSEAEKAAILAELQAQSGKVVEIAVDVPQ